MASQHLYRRSMTSTFLRFAVISVALSIAYLVPTAEDRAPKPTDAQLFPSTLLDRSPIGDRVFVGQGDGVQYAFGRWKQPVNDLAFHIDSDWQLKMRLLFTTKYWHYSSVNTDKYFVGAAVVKMGYASDAFVYVVDKTSPTLEKFEFTGRLPGDMGLTFADSSIDGSKCTTFTSFSRERIAFCYDTAAEEWTIQANVSMTGASSGDTRAFEANLRLKREEALALLYPVGNDTLRPAYVHKGAGAPVTGWIRLGSGRFDVSASTTPALGAIDWTRSQALRCTRWNWASTSFQAKVTTTVAGQAPTVDATASVGINLSRHVYDINGESQENAIWINGRVYVLRGVDFSVPPTQPLTDLWEIQTSPRVSESTVSESVKLTFTPSGGSREDHTHLLLVESDFVQPYGVFNGEITLTSEDEKTTMRVEIVEAFGVVEDHFALW